MNKRIQRLLRGVVMAIAVAGVWLLCSDSVIAQCAMCRSSFAGNPAFARNLNLGVLVLLAPPVTMFCVIFVVAFRHRKG